MAQIKKTITDALSKVPASAPDELRVVEALINANGHLKDDNSSWMLFGSRNLLAFNVIVSNDGFFEYGAFFEEYLISNNLASQHLQFCKQKETVVLNEFNEKDFSEGDFVDQFEHLSVSDKISALAAQVEFLLKENVALSEAYALLEGLVDDHITESG